MSAEVFIKAVVSCSDWAGAQSAPAHYCRASTDSDKTDRKEYGNSVASPILSNLTTAIEIEYSPSTRWREPVVPRHSIAFTTLG